MAITLQSAGQMTVGDDLAAQDVDLLLQAQRGIDGWRYSGDGVRVGSAFVLRTTGYELHGTVLRLTAKGAAAVQCWAAGRGRGERVASGDL